MLSIASGLQISCRSAPSQNSIEIRSESLKDGTIASNPIWNDPWYKHRFAVDDVEYCQSDWKKIRGKRIIQIDLLKRHPRSSAYEALPNEVGIRFKLENEMVFLFGHGLHNNKDDFAAIFESEIHAEITPYLRFETIAEKEFE